MSPNQYLVEGVGRNYYVAKEIAREIQTDPLKKDNFFKRVIHELASAGSIFQFSVIINRAYDVFAETREGSTSLTSNQVFQRVANNKIVFFYKIFVTAYNVEKEIYAEYKARRSVPMSRQEADRCFDEYKARIKRDVFDRLGYDIYGPYKDFATGLWNNLHLIAGPGHKYAEAISKKLPVLLNNIRGSLV